MEENEEFLDWGLTDYKRSLDLMMLWHECISQGKHGKVVILTEHNPPVLTVGKRGDPKDLRIPESQWEAPMACYSIQRGGSYTAHEPGQLVVYPLYPVKHISRFVEALEESVITFLRLFGLTGRRDPSYPGVWIGNEKLASLGLALQKGVTCHGLAINICGTLETFRYIHPCGIQGAGVTSFKKQGVDLSMNEAKKAWKEVWKDHISKSF